MNLTKPRLSKYTYCAPAYVCPQVLLGLLVHYWDQIPKIPSLRGVSLTLKKDSRILVLKPCQIP